MKVSTSFLKKGDYSYYIDALNNSLTDYIHFDVMDGKFVANKNLSFDEIDKYINMSLKPCDIHLMVSDPKDYIIHLSSFNVNNITVHREIDNYMEMIDLINSYGIKSGIAINPDTDVSLVFDILDRVSMVLVMSVYPGRSGQEFIVKVSDKIKLLREEIKKRNLNVLIAVDGGICDSSLKYVLSSDIVVSASYVLDDLRRIEKIKSCN